MPRTAVALITVPPKFKGKTLYLDPKIRSYSLGEARKHVLAEGGTVAADIDVSVDYLVLDSSRGSGKSAPEKAAAKVNAEGGHIQSIDLIGMYRMLQPTREEALALLARGPANRKRWDNFTPAHGVKAPPLDLTDADLRKADLNEYRLRNIDLTGADLRGADLRGAWIWDLGPVQLEGAQLDGVHITGANRLCLDGLKAVKPFLNGDWVECSLREVELEEAQNYYGRIRLIRCDLSKARLVALKLESSEATELVARDTDFTGASLKQIKWPKADCAKARFGKANLEGAVLSETILKGADLVGADLGKAKLDGADLRKANLEGANLAEADLTGAKLAGASFTGANIRGCKLDGCDVEAARGLAEARQAPPAGGPNLQELGQWAGTARIEIKVALDSPRGRVLLEITSYSKGSYVSYTERTGENYHIYKHGSSLVGVLQDLGAKHRGGQLAFDTLKVKIAPCPKKEGELLQLGAGAWCEVLGLPAPTADDLRQHKKASAGKAGQARDALVQELHGGPAGVAAWNAHSRVERDAAGKFNGVDLSGVDLHGVDLGSLQAAEAKFDNSDLTEAKLSFGKFRKATFTGANLTDANLFMARFPAADFSGALLTRVNAHAANFRDAVFHKADLHEANLRKAMLCGADLSSADLTGASLTEATCDSSTKFPQGFQPQGVKWHGPPPSALAPPPPALPQRAGGPKDFQDFYKRLQVMTDGGRLANALAMLKAEKFQLFSQVEPAEVNGVVRSQSSGTRVYACRVTSTGTYSCCTQNLFACGGLRGAPCKHILVLIIGLVRSGKLDPALADHWMGQAIGRRPMQDNQKASEVFLRYKGAEAGQIDWRPTETVPEDFYAL
jgi:uncharacterized protein YjbI with pentapeptide repeats